MRAEKQHKRRDQIEDAAFALLLENGYQGTSMLSVAKAAKASNETLYRWYRDKNGLFAALIASNTATLRAALDSLGDHPAPTLDDLEPLGRMLLQMLLGDRAIALNRAAAADTSGTLGAALAQGGRDTIAPMLRSVIARALDADPAAVLDPDQATEVFLSLLIGDAQIRRVIGTLPEPDPATIAARAARAVGCLAILARRPLAFCADLPHSGD